MDFSKQYLITWYNRRHLIDECIHNLENDNAIIVKYNDDNYSHIELNKCRIYFSDNILLSLEFITP